ncbi:MAG: hypothetical protein EXS05_09435 [Planctomycetaceae bacterium]|nr:hypothetical protein [Planctomycetaceae bacterium]
MNKAFVREIDTTDGRCPTCGSPGLSVYRETLASHLEPQTLENLTDSAFFCSNARCDVVYFDLFDRVVTQSAVNTPVYPKNPTAPLCACFGLTCDQIDQDLSEGSVSRTRAGLERAKSPDARCAILSPSGQNCVAEIQRYYMTRREAIGHP